MATKQHDFILPIASERDLRTFVQLAWGVTIPDTRVCKHHTTPWRAFCDAYFARAPVTVWKASRGFGGKSYLLAILGLTEAVTLKADVNILGGSGEQSENVHKYAQSFWLNDSAPRYLLVTDPMKRETRLAWGNSLKALMASQRSVRGPHPQKLRLDEIDEMDLTIFDAAMGQPMGKNGIAAQTVASSTHQYADGTMTEILRRAKDRGWPVQEWCYRESVADGAGWLEQREVVEKRGTVTQVMWCFPSDQIVIDGDGIPVPIFAEPKSVMSGIGSRERVLKMWERTGAESLLEFKVQGLPRPIRMTKNHEVLTLDGWKRAEDVIEDDVFVQPRRPLVDGGEYDDGWMVGLFLSEGTARKDVGTRISFAVHDSEAESVVSKIDDWISNHPYEHTGPGFASGGPYTHSKQDSACTIVSISYRPLRELIEVWTDIKLKANRKHLRFLPTDKEFIKGVLFGWLFGDGCETERGWVGSTSSQALAWQMFQIATDLGYATGMTYQSKRNEKEFSDQPYWHVRVSRFRTGWRRDPAVIEEAVNRYKAGEPTRKIAESLNVGRNNIKKWATQEPPKQYTNQPLDLEDKIGRRIRSIKEIEYSGVLCDIEVACIHSFLAGGIVVSNSTEYELQEPSPESRAINTKAVKKMFDRKLGKFKGAPGEYIEIEKPQKNGRYSTGADWARKQDWTVIVTIRTDTHPAKLVAFERTGRLPWPVMVKKFDERLRRFKGAAFHDGTGIGDVVDGYMETWANAIMMVGRTRSNMLSNYIGAAERREIVAPYIEFMEAGHRLASVDDVYGSGHLPDDIAAGALAWMGAQPAITVASGADIYRKN